MAWWNALAESKAWHIVLAIVGSGAFLTALKLVWDGVQKRVERGRRRVEESRPELLARGLVGTRQSGYVTLENVGVGAARNIRMSFSGSSGRVAGGDVGRGVMGKSRELQYGDSPFFRVAQAEPAHFTVLYADRLGNDYTLTVPVRQDPRADGEFNMGIDWAVYATVAPQLGWRDYYRLGK